MVLGQSQEETTPNAQRLKTTKVDFSLVLHVTVTNWETLWEVILIQGPGLREALPCFHDAETAQSRWLMEHSLTHITSAHVFSSVTSPMSTPNFKGPGKCHPTKGLEEQETDCLQLQ